ncbi:hypothetical protein [Paludibacterium yongneupense]|uniref:hypothetical protein n=1 Tax=Paludibacterium yongneupense TaxID=400061 RepID=UPI000423932A|nr:hypothetical protein [Paludibacterium yongneupense]
MAKQLNANDLFDLTMSNETLFDQANGLAIESHVRACTYFRGRYGEAYPEEHPEVVAAFMQVFAAHVQDHGNRVQMALLEMGVKELSEKVAAVSGEDDPVCSYLAKQAGFEDVGDYIKSIHEQFNRASHI